MKIFNFGSINIDHVYRVPHFVRAGETLASTDYQIFTGGKGLNQSVALAKAGARVFHVGKIGVDGKWVTNELEKNGVNVSGVIEDKTPTGHAIIQVSPDGENSILLFGGANQTFHSNEIDAALSHASSGDFVLIQNEINGVNEIIEKSYAQRLQVVFNPAPYDSNINKLPLQKVKILILNETEGEGVTGEKIPSEILETLTNQFPESTVILTLGAEGVLCSFQGETIAITAKKVNVVDTTAAGDTFIGYFLASLAEGIDVKTALKIANSAAAICVTRSGAAASIPAKSEVNN